MEPFMGGTKKSYKGKKGRGRTEEGIMPRSSYVWFKGAVVTIILTWILSSYLLVTARRQSKKSTAVAKQHHPVPNNNVVSNYSDLLQDHEHNGTDSEADTTTTILSHSPISEE
jgi:hypothetical protein